MDSEVSSLPFISILVMSHNQGAFIAPCISSVFAQQYDGKLEFIFCDDCSDDDTFSIIERMASQYTGPHQVITHRCPVNGKVAVNMNTAVALSHGDWLMRVDGDDILHPDRVRLTALAICRYPQAAAISGRFKPFHDVPPCTPNPPDRQLTFYVTDKTCFSHGQIPDGLQWWGCVMTIHRRVFTEFGGLPAACGIMDDTFFATRSLMLGQFVIITNACFLYYRRHAGNISPLAQNNKSLRERLVADEASRDYYRRCMPCYEAILAEIGRYAEEHPDCAPLLDAFQQRFHALRQQATFWQRSWAERISDACIKGPWWKKLPRALRTSCRLAWVLSDKLGF